MATSSNQPQGFGIAPLPPESPAALIDQLIEALVTSCFLGIWALIVAVYSGVIWIGCNTLEAHVALGMPHLSYRECAGLALMLAFLANAFTGITDGVASRCLVLFVEGLLDINFLEALQERRERRRHRRRESVVRVRELFL